MSWLRVDAEHDCPRPGYSSVTAYGPTRHDQPDEYMSLETKFLRREGLATWLHVIPLAPTTRDGLCLVQLPYEADSGANRMWVADDDLLQEDCAK